MRFVSACQSTYDCILLSASESRCASVSVCQSRRVCLFLLSVGESCCVCCMLVVGEASCACFVDVNVFGGKEISA